MARVRRVRERGMRVRPKLVEAAQSRQVRTDKKEQLLSEYCVEKPLDPDHSPPRLIARRCKDFSTPQPDEGREACTIFL